MKLAALCALMNTFFVVALGNTGVEHGGTGVPSHLSSEARSNTESNNDAAVQLCILMGPCRLILCVVLYEHMHGKA